MDVDLVLVDDDFKKEEHERLDELINELFPSVTSNTLDKLAPYIFYEIIKQLGDRSLPKYQNFSESSALLNNQPIINSMIYNGSMNGYRQVRLLQLLRRMPIAEDVEYVKQLSIVTVRGWQGMYKGDAADALWAHIEACFNKAPQADREFYAMYSTIVQSSGMGKSRAVDEMSKSHFTIPVVLREPYSSGFPPRDGPACRYLFDSKSQRDAFLRSCSFLHALFLQMTIFLKSTKTSSAAREFRAKMTEGMKHDSHNEWRTRFFEAVKKQAELVYTNYYWYFPDQALSTQAIDALLTKSTFPLRKVFCDLKEALKYKWVDDGKGAKRQEIELDPRSPSVVLAFDEVHTLTMPQDDGRWSPFGEIRRAIRGLKHESLFTLFLSTSGTLFSISSPPERDLSARMVKSGDVLPPFCELGFDQLAVHVDFSETTTISQVSSKSHFTSYGRPLWQPYCESGTNPQIIKFAALKLLGSMGHKRHTLSIEQKLACLAQRIPIEFLSACYASQVSDKEKEQVRSHMRVVLKVDEGLETMVTTSPSEPILSEAAYFVMTTQWGSFDPAEALQEILNGFAVHKGELGELVVALLFITARDNAVGDSDMLGSPLKGKRWCSLTGLLTSLFPTPEHASENHVNITDSPGWRFTRGGTEQLESSLADTFQDSKVYFTHFIKVHQYALVEVEFLMRLMARGAAILCANGQPGIDAVIPFLLEGDEIKRDNIGVILIQVKNDKSYTHKPKGDRVLKMDPRTVGAISPSADIPVIRLFFALAAKTPTLQVVHHESSHRVNTSYSAYDFWISGLSPELLGPVMNREHSWHSVLQASQTWGKMYSGGPLSCVKLRKSMNPGVATDSEFWENWCRHVPS